METAPEFSPQTPRAAPPKAKEASVDQRSSQRRPRPPRQPKPQGRHPKSEGDEAYSRAENGDFDANGTFTAEGSSDNVDKQNRKSKSRKTKPKPRTSNGPSKPLDGAADASPVAFPKNPPTVPETPMKAYAGPTFHASPAPSSLPIPKFFSKSVPSGTAHPSLASRLEREENLSPQVEANSSTSGSSPAMEDAKPQTSVARHESPLDVFFKADKAEKSNRKSLGAAPSSDQKKKSVLQPPQAAPTHWASIYGVPAKHSRNASTGSAKDLFMMELDGSANHSSPERGRHLGPRTITAPSRVPHYSGDQTPPKPSASLYYDSTFGVSTPVLPSEMEGSPAARPASVSSIQNAPIHISPRSAGSTPLPQAQHMPNPPFHYGNRNLSPLFNAVKAESTRRQSNLRMQVSPSSPTPGLEMPGSVPPLPPQMGDLSNTAARNYLQTHMGFHTPNPGHAHGNPASQPRPAMATELDGNVAGRNEQPAKSGLTQSLEANRRQHMPAILQSPTRSGPNPSKLTTPPTVQPSFSSPADLRSMENDLKRMLNLSNGRSGGR